MAYWKSPLDPVDLFAGPGGWSEALRMLGLSDIGVEIDPMACSTRAAAGHRTLRADVALYPAERFAGSIGLIASPPCQAFSAAGGGEGRDFIPDLVEAIHRRDWSARPADDPRVWLPLEVGRWYEAIRPEWVALEQVPAVLPLWRAYAEVLREDGCSVWCGKLNAADFGVPQTRERAILIASRVRVVTSPSPTHSETPTPGLFGPDREWMSMNEAIGWGFDTPAKSVCGHRTPRWLYRPGLRTGRTLHTNRDQRPDGSRQTVVDERPAPSVTAKSVGQWKWDYTEAITVPELLVLQSFRPDYPVQGGRTAAGRQVGDAVPVRLAYHILCAATGADPAFSEDLR